MLEVYYVTAVKRRDALKQFSLELYTIEMHGLQITVA